MNIQIFGKKKCFDTKKAERYFKERNIRVQMIDMAEKGMSKGEFTNVKQAVGGVEALIDENCRDKDLLALLKYLSPEDREEKILLNPQVIKTPVVETEKRRPWDTIRRYGKTGNRRGEKNEKMAFDRGSRVCACIRRLCLKIYGTGEWKSRGTVESGFCGTQSK